jgi:hypothetical protein
MRGCAQVERRAGEESVSFEPRIFEAESTHHTGLPVCVERAITFDGLLDNVRGEATAWRDGDRMVEASRFGG